MSNTLLILNPWRGLAEAFSRHLVDHDIDYLIVSGSQKICAAVDSIDSRGRTHEADLTSELGLRNAFAACSEAFGGIAHVIRVLDNTPAKTPEKTNLNLFKLDTLKKTEAFFTLAHSKIRTHLKEESDTLATDTMPNESNEDSARNITESAQPHTSISILLPNRVDPENPSSVETQILKGNLASLLRANTAQLGRECIAANLFCVDRVSDADLALKAVKARYPRGAPAANAAIALALLSFTAPHMAYISGHILDLNGVSPTPC